MTSDEGMMNAASVMRDAAETNQRAADRIEEAVWQMQILFDAGYGGTAPRLLEELEKANNALCVKPYIKGDTNMTNKSGRVITDQPRRPDSEGD